MILTLIGIILCLLPFLLIFCFANRPRAFLYITVLDFAFHLLLAIITQSLHIFTYPVIITTHAIIAAVVVVYMIRSKLVSSRIKINWFLVLSVAVILFELWSVHNIYTGPVNTINGPNTVSRGAYRYPYFSDEWVGASLENYSIKSHSLPAVNPLDANKPFKNPMLAFFSVISEFFLLFNLNPILNTSIFALFSGLFVCLSVYVLLRSVGIGNMISVFTILCIPFITNGANLPGIWYLMPFMVSFIFFIISLVGISSDDKKLSWISSFLALVLYPPMVVFIVPIFIAEYFTKNGWGDDEKIIKLSKDLLIILCAGVFVFLIVLFGSKSSSLWSYIFRTNLDGGIPSFVIWNIIPIVFLPFIFLGIGDLFKKKSYFILGPIIVGLVFWVFYTSTIKVFIIDYPRVVVITSILLVFCGGVGLSFSIKWLKQRYVCLDNKKLDVLLISVTFIIFITLSLFYPISQNWRKLSMKIDGITKPFSPAAPVNRYLTEDDLKLFGSFTGKRFISPAWKGLVIGVATGNYPLESKPSTITNEILSYNVFIQSVCSQKKDLAKKYKIDYVYSAKFQCKDFDLVGSGGEGLNLYKMK